MGRSRQCDRYCQGLGGRRRAPDCAAQQLFWPQMVKNRDSTQNSPKRRKKSAKLCYRLFETLGRWRIMPLAFFNEQTPIAKFSMYVAAATRIESPERANET